MISNKLWIFIIFICSLLISGKVSAQVPGCTDPLAQNYNPAATLNDGSCSYSQGTVSPVFSFNLDNVLSETSGLIYWDFQLWTHNDNSITDLYALDTLNGALLQTSSLPNVFNNDWEEISQDSNYIYIGDFGNNVNGNRTDLKILRVSKSSVILNSPVIDTISFSYSDQTNFSPSGFNNTDYDCEAFIVTSDSIYLFTKQWINEETSVYSLPKVPGNHIAQLQYTLNVNGLISGAFLSEEEKIIVLCGYSNLLQPFIYLLYDYSGNNYLSGNKRKISVLLPFHQVEGIASRNSIKYFITNEYFTQPPVINVLQKMHILDLNIFLGNYLSTLTHTVEAEPLITPFAFPNPAIDIISVNLSGEHANYELINTMGRAIMSGTLQKFDPKINISELRNGMYFLRLNGKSNSVFKLIKN